MNAWLAAAADRLSAETGIPREELELTPAEVDVLLRFAADAAHGSGSRANAPLACYLLGILAGRTGQRPQALVERLPPGDAV